MESFVLVVLTFALCSAQEPSNQKNLSQSELIERLTKGIEQKPQLAGEFFGVPVPLGNYYFAKKVVLTLSAPWRSNPRDEKELEDLTWQELLFSYEAFKRGIEASSQEVEEEIGKMLKADKVSFDWKKDKDAYKDWVKKKLNESVELFENQVSHLVKLNKLRKQVLDSIKPKVSQEEAYQKFLDEYNTLSVELVQFDDLKKAEAFYNEITKPLAKKSLDKLIWKELILSYEALKRKIEVKDEELDRRINRFLMERDLRFNWKKDKEKLESWLKEKFNLTEEKFREYISKFLKIEKLMQMIYNKEELPVDYTGYQKFLDKEKSIEKAYQEFLKKYEVTPNKILIFPTFKEAKEFYKKIKRSPGPWEEKKRQEPKLFKRPGFVALDFLIHMWGFSKDLAYKMIKAKEGSFYKPAPIYKGYAVFKILKKRLADPKQFEERKDYYFKRVEMVKKYEGYKEWVKKLKKEANLKVYIDTQNKPKW